MNIDILVNGKAEQTSKGASVRDLLYSRHIDASNARGIAIALNDEVVRRVDWPERVLESGDSIEIVTALQGG